MPTLSCSRFRSVTRPRPDAGYALLAVLWIAVGITGLTFAIVETARNAMAPVQNRTALTAASWQAAGCLAEVRQIIGSVLADANRIRPGAVTAWDSLDTIVGSHPSAGECTVTMRPLGARLDVNSTDQPTLARLFRITGQRPGWADSAALAIVAARPFVDIRQIHRLSGLESAAFLDSLLDIDSGPIALNHASAPILALLPGFTENTIREILAARGRRTPVSSFYELSLLLSPDQPAAAARLPGLVTFPAGAWSVTVRASTGTPAVTVALGARIVRTNSGTGAWGRRSWIE